jgi:hypothetical protein
MMARGGCVGVQARRGYCKVGLRTLFSIISVGSRAYICLIFIVPFAWGPCFPRHMRMRYDVMPCHSLRHNNKNTPAMSEIIIRRREELDEQIYTQG